MYNEFFYVFFETSTGRIRSTMFTDSFQGDGVTITPFPGIEKLRCRPGEEEDAYVVDGALVPRPPFPGRADKLTFMADGVDAVQLTALPNPNVITINDAEVAVTSPTLSLTSTIPRQFVVVANVWPYKDWTVTLEALA